MAKEKTEQERLAKEKAEQERLAKEKAEQEQIQEDLLWEKAQNINTSESYREYLRKSAFGKHAYDALTKAEELESFIENKEQKYWEDIQLSNTKEGYQQYIVPPYKVIC